MNEFEILKIRLHELDPIVDYFVLVESIETQRGDEKPLFFEENKNLFQPFLHKIIHVAVRERHPELTPWQREHFQRNQIMKGLENKSQDQDIILISDADEIPKREIIEKLKNNLMQCPYDAYRLQQKMFFFQLNRIFDDGKGWRGELWWGTIATTYALLSKVSPQFLRDRREKLRSKEYNAGWHFTYMGGLEKIRQKLSSIVEGLDAEKISDQELKEKIQEHKAVSIDESFPSYIRENLEYFKSLGFIAEE
ncbi:MAG: benzoate transporter [Simkaniaceae bacterium]